MSLGLHAKLIATIVKGIIEKDKELFLNGFMDISKLQEDIIASDKNIIDYADTHFLFFLETARQVWPGLVVVRRSCLKS